MPTSACGSGRCATSSSRRTSTTGTTRRTTRRSTATTRRTSPSSTTCSAPRCKSDRAWPERYGVVGDYVPNGFLQAARLSVRLERLSGSCARLRATFDAVDRRRRRRRPALRGDRRPARLLGRCSSTTPRRSPRRSASPAAAAATSPTATPAPANFVSANPRLLPLGAGALHAARLHRAGRSATGIAWHEKHKGQLFCDELERADHRDAARANATPGGVHALAAVHGVDAVRRSARPASSSTPTRGPVRAAQLVVATGGLSIPKIGATDFGYRLARQFGHRIVETAAGAGAADFRRRPSWAPFAALAGRVAAGRDRRPAKARARRVRRGPAVHPPRPQRPGGAADLELLATRRSRSAIDLAPGAATSAAAAGRREADARRRLGNALADLLPRRLADAWLAPTPDWRRPPDGRAARPRPRRTSAAGLQRWTLTPTGTEGYRKAEVTAGGVDTRELDSQHAAKAGACRGCTSSARSST